MAVTTSEKVIRRLYEITHNYHLGFATQVEQLLSMGLERFNLDIGILAKVENNEYVVKGCVVPSHIDISPGFKFDLGNTLCQITCDANGPVALEHIGTHQQYGSHPAYLSGGLESYVGIPIKLNGELYGTLNFSSPTPYKRKFKHSDIDTLQLMASWIEGEIIRRDQEKLVNERTSDLTKVNEKLKVEIERRKIIELELINKEANLKEAQRIASIGSWQLDIPSGLVVWSEELYNMYGFDPNEPVPIYSEHHKLFTPESWEKLSTALDKTSKEGNTYNLELETVRNNKKNGWMWVRGEAKRNKNGRIVSIHGVAQDISERKRVEEQLKRIAHFDLLTNMPNRVLLADRLNQAMVQCKRRNLSLAVAFMDLDGFKAINDRYGHGKGDELLIVLSQRMKEALREGDTLSRIGGDEFIAVLVDLENIEDCEPVLKRLLSAAAAPVISGDAEMQVSVSIGISLYPQDDVDADLLIRHADQAMYVAKQTGKNRYHFFDVTQDDIRNSHEQSIGDIRSALNEGEFILHYQPKVNMHTGEVIGVEALIRWQHPDRGLIPPLEFLPVIEGHDVSLSLGEWVIDTALNQIQQWRSIGVNLPVSVNISAYQLQQINFTTRLEALLKAHPEVPSGCLELEILETSGLHDIFQVSETMNACYDLGVSFSLDDFGTGHSSLTYLKRLPAQVIKIDQSFVRDMLEDPDDLAIVEGVVGLAKSFRRKVIAEGVETVAHGVALLQLGCELAQGYGIARPMLGANIPYWVSNWKADDSWKRVTVRSGSYKPYLRS